MERITKQTLLKSLRTKKNGEIFLKDIEKLKVFKREIKPKTFVAYAHYWEDVRKPMYLKHLIDTGLLSKFCSFCKGSYKENGKLFYFIKISTKEYNKLQKRLSYFI